MTAGRVFGLAGVYACGVFGIGAALGAIRVFVVSPAIGPVAAVLVELPLMLFASWIVWGRVTRGAPPLSRGSAVAAGVLALVVLVAFEALLGMILGQAPAAILSAWSRPEGAIGLAGQLAFAAIPLVRRTPGSGGA